MYRALYAYNSKLPKYLSFEAGDKFTLVDTSRSDQWFLAQNGLGEIGFVPFNYIKKIEASVEQQVKFIDGAMEAIHLQATNAGGQYSHEQRMIMKKLVKHRSDVIKNASSAEGKSGRRRPAPAPPVEKSASLDMVGAGKTSSLAVVGRSTTINTSPTTSGDKKELTDSSKGENSKKKKSASSRQDASPLRGAQGKGGGDSKRGSTHSETVHKETEHEESVRKSKSVTSSIGQAPSLVSSYSSNASQLTATDSVTDASRFSDDGGSGEENLKSDGQIQQTSGIPITQSHQQARSKQGANSDTSDLNSKYQPDSDEDYLSKSPFEVIDHSAFDLNSGYGSNNHNTSDESQNHMGQVPDNNLPQLDMPPPPPPHNTEESYASTTSSASGANDLELPLEDLPPPPPEVYDDIVDEQFNDDETLPPAPPDLTPTEEVLKVDDMYVSLNSDILELCGRRAIEECSCDDFQPKFDPSGRFFARNALKLPPERSVNVKAKEREEPRQASHVFGSLLKLQDNNPDKLHKQQQLLELAQAHCVQVTHADCEEIIGEFRKVTNLSHEESHWAILAVMNLLAAKVPHIGSSLEVVGMRLNMAHECRSTGHDYQCQDTLTIDRLISELADVTNDAQQRGHYLRDDLDSIIDIITGLTDTLSNAKHCVSVAAIQKENYNMVEVIAKYYQMETRWVIHSCLLQLIETICRMNPKAIQEFLYSELPQEMVAEIQQHHHDESRFLQVSKTLGIIFMKAQPSPHKLSTTMDLHFFIWLLGMIENMAELNRLNDVDMLLALVCAYHLQHEDQSTNPVTEALKMAHGHALLESALIFLSKHDDPTKLLESGLEPKLNSVILLLTNLFDNPDTSDLLYTNDVEALIGIYEEFLRDLSADDPVRVEILHLLENFMRNYPDTVTLRTSLCLRLGPLLVNIREEKNKCGEMAAHILEDNSIVFDEM